MPRLGPRAHVPPRLPGEQRGQRTAGAISSEDRGAQDEPAQDQRGGGDAQSTVESGERVEGVFRGVEEHDDTNEADHDDRDHAESQSERAPKDPVHVGGEQVDHRGCAVTGEVRPKKTASKVGLS